MNQWFERTMSHGGVGLTTSTASFLSEKHHSQITEYLSPLGKQEQINVGLRLGLRFRTLNKMSSESFLNEMVNAWLMRDDDVKEGSGDPSWESLCIALESCGHKGIASDIKLKARADHNRERHFSDSATTPKHNSTETSPEKTSSKELSTSLPSAKLLDKHPSYHRAITGEEAETRLKRCTSHGYLTRYSENRGSYVLSVYQGDPYNYKKHFKINIQVNEDEKTYKINGNNMGFKTLKELLTHYETNGIDPSLENIGECLTEQEYMESLSMEGKQKDDEENKRLRDELMKVKNALEASEQKLQETEAQNQQTTKNCCTIS